MGFRTESGKKITLKGVKPQQILQWHYDYYYIYGLVEPVGGRSCLGRIPLRLSAARGRLRFFYEFSHFNSDCFEVFLEKFAQEHSNEIHIIQLDNASCHTTSKLIIPENVVLLFQPPYCEGLSPEFSSGACKPRPELNPIERVWHYIKQQLKNLWFSNLDDVKLKVANILNSLSENIVHSLTGWQYILDALSL